MKYFMFCDDEIKQCVYTGVGYTFNMDFLPKRIENVYRFYDNIDENTIKPFKSQKSKDKHYFSQIVEGIRNQINGKNETFKLLSCGKNFFPCLMKYYQEPKNNHFTLRIYKEMAVNYVEVNEKILSVSIDVNNDEISEGYIVTQSIAADTMVQPGTTITLYVSKGKEKIVLPDVAGYDYEEAEKRLTELGFVCEKIETREGEYRNNEVVSMAPIAEQSYYKNTTVYLRVFIAESEPVTDEFGNIIETEETTDESGNTEETSTEY